MSEIPTSNNGKQAWINAPPDIPNSTYRHVIHTSGTLKDYEMIGYSKKAGFPEALNKDYLLRKMLPAIYDKYFNHPKYGQLKKIEVFRRNLPDYQEEKIIEIGDDFYVSIEYSDLCSQLITEKNKNNSVLHLVPKKKVPISTEKTDFDLQIKRFSTENALIDHCKYLVSTERYNRGYIESFYRKYKLKFL